MVKKVERKSMLIRESGRSTDFITPSFGYGCLLDCSYCYMKRHLPKGLNVAQNYAQILSEVNNHAFFTNVEKPNQTHAEYTTYDISCNEDFALHAKFHKWEEIFTFFKEHPIAMASFATKVIPKQFLAFNPNKKVRIRFSLMPQSISTELEPNTPLILDRIKAINSFIDAGYDVHVNFSPVVHYNGWLADYEELFDQLDTHVKDEYKSQVKAEVIFLTHNEDKHVRNLEDNLTGEDLLWTPENQEKKVSQYGGKNIRYSYKHKPVFIKEWKKVHKDTIAWNTIRYIF